MRPLALLVAGLLAGAGAARAGVDYIQTIVGDGVITRQRIEMLAGGRQEALRDAYDTLVNRELVLQEFKRLEKERGVKLLPDAYIDDLLKQDIEQKFFGDRERFMKGLREQGMTLEEYRTRIRDDLVYRELVRQFVPEPIISPNKIEAYYREHPEKYKMEERVKFSWIVLMKASDDTNGATRARAGDILSAIKGGGTFDEMVKTYSQRPQRSEEWLEFSSVNEAFRVELGKVKPGECTGVIETPEAVYVLRLDQRDAAHVTPLSELRGSISQDLRTIELNRRREAYFQRLRSKTLIQNVN